MRLRARAPVAATTCKCTHPRQPSNRKPGGKLTHRQQTAICTAFLDGVPAIALAREYGVSRQCINQVLRRRDLCSERARTTTSQAPDNLRIASTVKLVVNVQIDGIRFFPFGISDLGHDEARRAPPGGNWSPRRRAE